MALHYLDGNLALCFSFGLEVVILFGSHEVVMFCNCEDFSTVESK